MTSVVWALPLTDTHFPSSNQITAKEEKKRKKRGFPVKSKHAWCKQAHVYSMQQCRNQDTFALFLFKILLVFYASHQHLQVQPPHVINKDSSNITQSNPKSSIRNTWRAFLTLKGPQVLRWGLDLIFGKNTPCKSSKLKLVLSRVKKKYYKIESQREGETGKRRRKWRRSESEGKEEGMRAEGGRSAPAVPWASTEPRISSLEKLSFLSHSLENSASTPLITAAVHTHIHFHTVLHAKTDAVFCRVLLTPTTPCCP